MVSTGTAINGPSPTRLYLNGRWSLDEFELLFRSFNDLYRLIAAFTVDAGAIDSFVNVPVPFHRGRLNRMAREQQIPPLRVLRINYSSPGSIDLMGLGKVAEVSKDALFGFTDRIINAEDRELDRDRKLLENEALHARTARETEEATLKRAMDGELHELIVEEKRIANERAHVALSREKLEAAGKGLEIFKQLLDTARENGASEDDVSKMLTGFIAKVGPIVPLILERKLLAKPSKEE
jgi:hypothetical protein